MRFMIMRPGAKRASFKSIVLISTPLQFGCLALVTGCIAYNPECAVDTSETAGFTDVRLALSPTLLRTREMPVGNLIADAIYDNIKRHGGTAQTNAVDLALINSGSIRDITRCEQIDAIGPGPITRDQIAVLLPFNNTLAMVEVRGTDLLRALEHSVAHLGETGDWGLAGQFLQVSHLRFGIDCLGNPAIGDQIIIGSRIVDGSVMIIDGTTEIPIVETDFYNIATNAFIASGGDGYSWLTKKFELPNVVTEFDALKLYIEETAELSGPVAPQVEGRITIDDNCEIAAATP